jgi:hypothetical protein
MRFHSDLNEIKISQLPDFDKHKARAYTFSFEEKPRSKQHRVLKVAGMSTFLRSPIPNCNVIAASACWVLSQCEEKIPGRLSE